MGERKGKHQYWLNVYASIVFILMVLSQCGCQQTGTNFCSQDIGAGVREWREWSSGSCSSTCGIGRTRTLTRTRCCNDVPYICDTTQLFESKSENCPYVDCPVHGILSQWGAWNNPPCSVTCGETATKVITRTRTCTPPQHGGRDCVGSLRETQSVSCGFGSCPVHGGYTAWGVWSIPPCPSTCGSSVTVKTRSRTCSNPTPIHGGRPCSGSCYETRSHACSSGPCPVVHGGYTAWSVWSIPPCPSTCGSGVTVKTRSRTCSNPTPNHGGRPCSGSTYETSSHTCTLGPCPVDGVLSEWGPWNNIPCPVTCGASATKVITRTRTCSPPQHGGKQCTDSLTETRIECCGVPACPVNGGYTLWSSWSHVPCPATCGVSVSTVRMRSRNCTNPEPSHGGNTCSGPSFETSLHNCGLVPCPVDGVALEWNPWNNAPCSVTCGVSVTKVITRTRTCTPPQHGGKQCTDSLTETRTEYCGLFPCIGIYF